MNDRIRETHQLVESRFGKQFGENKKSTMEDMVKFANEIVKNYSESKQMLETVFLKLSVLEELIMPKRMALDEFSTTKMENLDAKSGNLLPPDDQFDPESDTGPHPQSTKKSSKRRYSIKSEPGDVKERVKHKLKSMSKSVSQIAHHEKSKRDRGGTKQRSKGKHTGYSVFTYSSSHVYLCIYLFCDRGFDVRQRLMTLAQNELVNYLAKVMYFHGVLRFGGILTKF